MDTNAPVNSLASFHAVMGPEAVYSACTYSFHTVQAVESDLKLCELIIACSTLLHNTLSACTNHLLVLTNVVLHTEFSQIRHCIGGGGGGGGDSKLRSATKPERAQPFPRFLFPETQNSASSCIPAARLTSLVHN